MPVLTAYTLETFTATFFKFLTEWFYYPVKIIAIPVLFQLFL